MILFESRLFWFQNYSEGAKGFQTAKYRALNVTSLMESGLKPTALNKLNLNTSYIHPYHRPVIVNPHS